MTTRKVPRHIPIHEFFRRFSTAGKISFLLLLSVLFFACVAMIVAANDPTRWAVKVSEITAEELQEVQIGQANVNFRSISVTGGAWMQTAAYVAGPILPNENLSILFAILLAIGISFFLAGLTKVQNFASAIGYGITALMFLLHGLGQYKDHPAALGISVAGMAALALLAFVFHKDILQWSIPLRGFSFLVLNSGILLAGYISGGWQALHSMEVSIFPACILFLIGWLILNGRELVNVILLASTNAKNPGWRLPFPFLFAVCLMLLGLELVMVQNEYRWGLIKDLSGFPLRPVHLLAITALVAPFTSQNLWLKIRETVSNVAYTFGLLGMSLIAVATLFYYTAQGDFIFLYMIERLTIGIFFATGAFYLFYIVYNFWNSLGLKDNFYYLSMMPRKLMYVFVPVLVILFSIGLEASDSMKVRLFFNTNLYNLWADREMVAGNQEEAMLDYQLSTYNLPGDVKGNYNYAILCFALKGDEFHALEAYESAASFIPLPFAALNKGNIELANGKPWVAKLTLFEMAKRNFHPAIGNNLAIAWMQDNQPDSAIYWLKKTVSLGPELSTPAANLGIIYLTFGKQKFAREFLKASVESESLGSCGITNVLFYNLAGNEEIPIDTAWANLPQIQNEEAPLVNFALHLIRKKQFAPARKVCNQLLKMGETPSAMLLDGMLLFESGKFDLAYSRIQYLAKYSPEFAARAWHYLGYSFFSREVPEMAALYFHKAAEAGLTSDLFNEAVMEIEVGNHEKAFQLLSSARGIDESLMVPVSHEISMLQAASGFGLEAMVEWDMKEITPDERIRIGRYAGQSGNIPVALEYFSQVIQEFPKLISPYIEMSRIRLERNDSLAENEIRLGLEKDPANFELQCMFVESNLMKGKTEAAISSFSTLQKGHEKETAFRLLKTKISIAKKDTALAISELRQLILDFPLNQKAILFLGEIYKVRGEDFEGQVLMSEAIRLNSRNADFQYYLAVFERGLGRLDEAGRAAQKAMELKSDALERNRKISDEFKNELKAFLNPQGN